MNSGADSALVLPVGVTSNPSRVVADYYRVIRHSLYLRFFFVSSFFMRCIIIVTWCIFCIHAHQVYKEHGYLWHFTLEEQMDYGPSIVAKFAHHERRVLEELGQRVRLAHNNPHLRLPCVTVRRMGRAVFIYIYVTAAYTVCWLRLTCNSQQI